MALEKITVIWTKPHLKKRKAQNSAKKIRNTTTSNKWNESHDYKQQWDFENLIPFQRQYLDSHKISRR